MKKTLQASTLLLICSLLLASPAHAQSPDAVVHAVLFYSPNCGHCHFVITETLPPLFEQYGDQLQIVGVDVTQPGGQTLFLAALQKFGLENGGVPFLVIGNGYLIGSGDIPEQLPGMIETYLAQGGVDYPDIPGLREALGIVPTAAPQADPGPVSPPGAVSTTVTLPEETSWQDKFARDPLGNSLSVLMLVLMAAAVGWSIVQFGRPANATATSSWGIPLLCLAGMGVAGYLAYVETTNVEAVCGPVGDCNTVQQSEYARLFGILPIGVLGLIGYTTIILTWVTTRFSTGTVLHTASLSLLALSGFGVLFSIYLTFLEPFVIGATCAWCLTSALLMTVIFLLTVPPARAALAQLQK